MFLTHNYVVLNRTFDGPGLQVHHANKSGFVNITFERCSTFDFHVVEVVNEQTEFRIQIGNNNSGIMRKLTNGEENLTIRNLPIDKDEQIWIATNKPNKFCVYGYISDNPHY